MSIASIQRDLGRLLAEVENLKEGLARADEGRRTLHQRMDAVLQSLASIVNRQDDHAAELATIKPVVDDVRRWKQMGIGALAVVGLGGTALGATIAGSLETLLHWLRLR